MTPQALLERFDELGYRLEISQDKLRVIPPSQDSDEVLIALLRTYKADVMALLAQREGGSTPEQRDRSDFFPLSDMQQAYLLGRGEEFEGGGISSHVYHEISGTGLDLFRLESALQQLVVRHPALRTHIMADGTQCILDCTELTWTGIRHHDLSLADESGCRRALRSIRAAMSHQVMPIDRRLWLDVQLASLPNGQQVLFVSHDGLAVDGISMLLLFRDWHDLYDGVELPPLAAEANYRQYILSKAAERKSAIRERSKSWWMARIDAGLPSYPRIPLAQDPDAADMRRWSRHVSSTDAATYARLKNIARANGLSTTTTVLAVWCDILALWGGGSAFTLNVTVADRPPFHPDIYQAIGNFTGNTLLAVDRTGGDTFAGRAQTLQQQLYQDLEHREFSGLEVLRELARRGAATRMPFTFNSTLEHAIDRLDGTEQFGPALFGISQTPQVWLNVFVMEQAGALLVQLDAVDALFSAGMLAGMAEALQSALHTLATNEDAWLGNHLAAMPAHQQMQRLASNDTASPIPAVTLYEAFLSSAGRYPEHIAIRTGDREMTYAELTGRSAGIAAWIDQLGTAPGTPIAVVMPKGWEQIAAILGILRAGAAYLPIDPETPPARIALLLNDAEVVQVLTTQAVLVRDILPPDATRRVLSVDQLDGPAGVPPWQSRNQPEDLAYVLYTSGTTGHPKGVMISHRSVINLVTDIHARYGITASDVVFGVSSFIFDLSVFDIFGTLTAGATLVLPDHDKTADAAHWLALAVDANVTIWNSVPAIVRMLLDEAAAGKRLPESLRLIMLSGDRIPATLPKAIRAQHRDVAIHSLGGPTETTVWNIQFPIQDVDTPWVRIPYGKPISNNRYYILNEQLQPCPDWVPGELHAAGAGNAIGYWKDPARTEASFFYHATLQEYLYRTGDTGCFLPDGNIDISGRADFQIKLNGYRIEPGEIEALIGRIAGVSECAVVLSHSNGNQALVAYIKPQAGIELDPVAVRALLGRQLPAWMIPHHFLAIDNMPLTPNAKIDRSALSLRPLAPVAATADTTVSPSESAPSDAMRQRIASLWRQVLPVSGAEPGQDFYLAGGDSLAVARLAGAIRKEFGIRISLVELLRLRTIQEQAAYLQTRLQSDASR